MAKTILYIILSSLLLATLSFYAGKRAAQATAKTTEVSNTVTHTIQVETETKKKDGTIQIVTTTDTAQSINDIKTQQSTSSQDLTKWNISAIVSEDIRHIFSGPAYGVSITHKLIGPVTVSGFGLTSGIIGVGIGVNF